jgi:hypothetical protein
VSVRLPALLDCRGCGTRFSANEPDWQMYGKCPFCGGDLNCDDKPLDCRGTRNA